MSRPPDDGSGPGSGTGAGEVRWLTPEEQRAWRGFLRLHDRIRGRLSRSLQERSNLSGADYAVLVELTAVPDGRLRILDLARELEWERSRMSHHLTRMAGRGLVVRDECAEDGRGAYIVLTPAGRAAIEAAAPRQVEEVREIFLDQITPSELRMLAELSERVVSRMAEPRPEPDA